MKYFFSAILLFSSLFVLAQQEYITTRSIYYYPDSAINRDAYKAKKCLLDFYYPKGAKNFATIVWMHGGGLTGGDREIPKALMDRGYAVVGVTYRLSPNVKAPAYIEDAAAAVAWTFKNIGKYGGNTKLIFLSGHSAGGYLEELVTLDKKYLAKYNIDANQVAALIPFSGQAITHFTIRKERGIAETQAVIDEYAPTFHVRADAPPVVLITGDREMELLGRYEENAYMARMMKLAGHKNTTLYELDGFDHGGMPEPAFPLLRKIVDRMTKEILAKSQQK